MKKIELILIIIVSILALIVIASVIFLPKKSIQPSPAPIQFFSPSPVSTPAINTSQKMGLEKIKQENYAQAREEFIQAKPWVLKLPLKSDNYFITYDPDLDSLIVDLYYLDSSDTKDQQLVQAKQDALSAMTTIGIDVNKQAIEYLERTKNQ